jgi:hypothetical protein
MPILDGSAQSILRLQRLSVGWWGILFSFVESESLARVMRKKHQKQQQ